MPNDSWFIPALKEVGFHIACPYHENGLLLRLLREFFFRFKLPFKKVWYKNIEKPYTCFFISASLITVDYITWIKSNHPNARVVLFYLNKVDERRYNPFNIPTSLCDKWTIDRDDAAKYGMHLWTGGEYFPKWKKEKSESDYDVFYIGKDKNRFETLQTLEKDMNQLGLKTLFYITWKHKWQKNDGIHKQFLPYEDVLDLIANSKAILHLIDGAQKGITIRVQESLIHRKKLITDDIDIVNYDFYHPNNIFVLGKDRLEELPRFIELPYVYVETEFFKHPYFEDLIIETFTDFYLDS